MTNQNTLIQFHLTKTIKTTAWTDDEQKLNITLQKEEEIQCADKPTLFISKINLNSSEINSLRKSLPLLESLQQNSIKYWYKENGTNEITKGPERKKNRVTKKTSIKAT